MAARKEVWAAADGVRARGPGGEGTKPQVLVRTVQKEIGKGSFGDIAGKLAAWRERVGYQPVIEQANLPEALQRQLTLFGTALLEHVRIEQTRQRIAKEEGEAARRTGYEETLKEALAQVNLLEAKVALLKVAGWRVNDKRVERIWRREGLKVPAMQPKRGRIWDGDGSCLRLRAEHRDHVWSYDFLEARTHDGRKLRMLNVFDEFTRECLAIGVARKLKAVDVIDVLSDLFILRVVPCHIHSDNLIRQRRTQSSAGIFSISRCIAANSDSP